ncbi:MAG TPA: lysophospholipid acyltransferase family protein [Polyangiaceae bacterium]|nr:lysophospholipid acyltransferase family protein [Polyangiaceae bacterium]
MIEADKWAPFEAWFLGRVRARLRAGFTSLKVRGAEHVREAAGRGPQLWVGNHTSWWDPLIIFYLSRGFFDLDGHAMMDASNLRKLPFFSRIGAFGVDLGDPADGARALRYAARLLRGGGPRRMVAVFPQGSERPVTERPLGFRPGSAELARLAPAAGVLPFALRYEMQAEEKPNAYVAFGAPLGPERSVAAARAAQEAAVARLLDELDGALCAGELSGYTPLFVSRPALAPLATEALAWAFRPRKG